MGGSSLIGPVIRSAPLHALIPTRRTEASRVPGTSTRRHAPDTAGGDQPSFCAARLGIGLGKAECGSFASPMPLTTHSPDSHGWHQDGRVTADARFAGHHFLWDGSGARLGALEKSKMVGNAVGYFRRRSATMPATPLSGTNGEPSVIDPETVTEAQRELGRRLATYRRAAGYNQTQLARLTAYSRSTIANVEGGRQSVPRTFGSVATRRWRPPQR